jgi:dienelactone hydrolase
MTHQIVLDPASLPGDLEVPDGANRVVLFAHGSGSSRTSPRNRAVAQRIQDAGIATLLFDLLTPEEEARDEATHELSFDVGLLAERLVGAVDWVTGVPEVGGLPIGLFGASTGAAAALVAAAERPEMVQAVVSRGGRPDLVGDRLELVRAPVLLIVGGADEPVLELNRQASRRLADHRLEVVPGASHLFPEPGALEAVAELAATWFEHHLGRSDAGS